MVIPANLGQAAAPWGAEACVICWGTEGGPYHVADTGTPLPVQGTLTVNPAAATTGGATPYHYLAAAGANQDSQNVKASAGTLYTVACFNVNAAVRYLKLYDKATAPTSADTPVQTYAVPAATTGAGFVLSLPVGMSFANGIGFRMTTGQSDGDSGAVTAGDLALSITYK
jgi:hypothetical protein